MRILFLTQWFDPEPANKGLLFAKELVNRGHSVHVLTGFPNYPEGKLYPGYRLRCFQREKKDGVQITRVFLHPSHDRNPILRVLNYLSFMVSAAIAGCCMKERFDVIYAYHPPATVGIAAALIGAFKRIPFVYDIQDLWPDTIAQSGMLTDNRVLSLIGRCCGWIYRRAAHLLVLSPGFKKTLIERGVPETKLTVVKNWCDESNIAPRQSSYELAASLGMKGRFNVVFAGNMGKAQGLDTLLEAANLLRDKQDIHFVCVGGGTERTRLMELARSRGLANVRFLDRRPMHEIADILSLADGLLVHLEDHPLFRITIPSKTQAYMRMGKPILMGVMGDAAEIVATSRAGICFHPSDPVAMTDAVLRLFQTSPEERRAMGARARRAYDQEMSLEVGVAHIEKVLVHETNI